MPQIFTSQNSIDVAKSLLHDIMYFGGLRPTDQRTTSRDRATNSAVYVNAAKAVCNELVNRDFSNVDQSINILSQVRFYDTLTGQGKYVRMQPEKIAKAIVYLAEQLQIFWDDTIRTPYEISEFQKTQLGNAVYKYGRYISAIKPQKKSSSKNSVGSSTNSGTGSSANAQPKNGFKQSGPKSGEARDLRGMDGVSPGTPGEKCYAEGPISYKLVGSKQGQKTEIVVFVRPLHPKGAAGSTNKVFVGSGRSYGECICFFDDHKEAQDFLDKVVASGIVPNDVVGLQVNKTKSESNGYFLVGTEFGVCAISANKLNEDLEESCDEDNRRNDWKKATEGYSPEEIKELHTWMRRD